MQGIISAEEYGGKDALAITDGFLRSAGSRRDPLPNLKARGSCLPGLAVDDGALVFPAALRDVHPTTRQSCCRIRRTANGTGSMSRGLHVRARSDFRSIWMAETRREAEAAVDLKGNSPVKFRSQGPMASSAGGRAKGRSKVGRDLPPAMTPRPSIGCSPEPPIRGSCVRGRDQAHSSRRRDVAAANPWSCPIPMSVRPWLRHDNRRQGLFMTVPPWT